MAETNARVMDMVRRELEKNPSMSSEELFEKAKKVDRGIARLNVRQFHARYPLQVKRAAANARKAASGGRSAAKKAARKTRGAGRAASATKGARRGRPPGTKTGRRGRPPASAGAAPARRRGRPPRAAAAPASGASGGEPNRDRVRSLLLQFARDIAGAEGKADMVDVISNVDRWVDQVVAAAR